MIVRRLIAAIALLLASACTSTPVGTPSDAPFDIVAYFDGRIYGYGVIERGDRIVSRFDMIVEGGFEDKVLTLDETFLFDNGSDFRRAWRLTREAPGVWVGGADNVEGVTRVEVIDGVVRMHYVAEFPNADEMISLRFDQRLFPMAGGVVMNRSRLTKFGVPVGTVTVVFTPENYKDAPQLPSN